MNPHLDGEGGTGLYHTSRSRYRTHPRRWEVCIGKRPHLHEGWGCRPPPHLVEPLPDSPAMVGGAHRQVSTPGQRSGCWPPPHHVVSFLDSPTMVEGAHRQVSMGRGALVVATPAKTFRDWPVMVGGAHRRSSTPRWREWEELPHRAEPFSGFACDSGRHAPANRRCLDGGSGRCRHTAWSRF
jgi:hypothetical protein